MKRKVVSVLMCAAMATTLLAGCGGNSSESTSSANSGSTTESSTSADSNSASSSSADSSSADSSSASSSSAAVTGDLSGAKGMHFEIVAKGFQHSYWQAVLKGAQFRRTQLRI